MRYIGYNLWNLKLDNTTMVVPFIITEELKLFYYHGLQEWNKERGYLRDTCMAAQDQFKQVMDYFGIRYEN